VTKGEKEKKNKRAGMIISAGSHIMLMLLFIFLVAWRAPNPPHPEFGIELNFGTSDVGTGEIQPETTAADADTEEEAAPDTPEEVEEEVIEETTTATEEAIEASDSQEEIAPVTDTPTEDPIKEVDKKTTEKKLPAAEAVEAEEKKEDPTPPKVLYPGTKEGAAGTTGDSKNPASANQGDKTNALGDQGDEEGNVDARALYGNPGGGGGTSLEMTGWKWDSPPDPKEETSQSGKIVFELIIDERGEVTSARATSYTVSASLVRIYQAEVEKLTFSKTSSGPAPPVSKGRITFIIKAK